MNTNIKRGKGKKRVQRQLNNDDYSPQRKRASSISGASSSSSSSMPRIIKPKQSSASRSLAMPTIVEGTQKIAKDEQLNMVAAPIPDHMLNEMSQKSGQQLRDYIIENFDSYKKFYNSFFLSTNKLNRFVNIETKTKMVTPENSPQKEEPPITREYDTPEARRQSRLPREKKGKIFYDTDGRKMILLNPWRTTVQKVKQQYKTKDYKSDEIQKFLDKLVYSGIYPFEANFAYILKDFYWPNLYDFCISYVVFRTLYRSTWERDLLKFEGDMMATLHRRLDVLKKVKLGTRIYDDNYAMHCQQMYGDNHEGFLDWFQIMLDKNAFQYPNKAFERVRFYHQFLEYSSKLANIFKTGMIPFRRSKEVDLWLRKNDLYLQCYKETEALKHTGEQRKHNISFYLLEKQNFQKLLIFLEDVLDEGGNLEFLNNFIGDKKQIMKKYGADTFELILSTVLRNINIESEEENGKMRAIQKIFRLPGVYPNATGTFRIFNKILPKPLALYILGRANNLDRRLKPIIDIFKLPSREEIMAMRNSQYKTILLEERERRDKEAKTFNKVILRKQNEGEEGLPEAMRKKIAKDFIGNSVSRLMNLSIT